ncbi:MAG: AraC family transcriptional regulator [Clostridiales bacterium]|nr:AraC family transcriptional regulator [Clostridiales bacterium]
MHELVFSVFPSENFVDLGLYQFGWERCKPSHSFGPAARNHYLFHYVLSGTGTLMAQDSDGSTQTYHIKSRQGFMIFPGQITTYIADNERPWEYVWIEFDGLRAAEAIGMAGLSRNSPVYRPRSKSLCEEMAKEMLYIKNNKDAPTFHLIGHLYLFLDYLVRSAADFSVPKGSKLSDFYVHEAVVYIEHNFQNNISVEDIAAVCGLNRSYFGKIFKETMGKSPQEFLINYRMIKAAELLKLTKLSIGDIGNAVGYENQLHFSRAFKNIYGISPRECSNKNRIHSYPSKAAFFRRRTQPAAVYA